MRRPPGALPRRAFLFTGAAAALGAFVLPRGLRLGAALPIGHHFNPDADSLAREAARFDALLIPAYIAAELVAHNTVRQLHGSPKRSGGRAHDPEGAFTIPHRVVHFISTGTLDELFSPRALWPRFGRLALAVALLRRGYPVNDSHPGHLKQIESDLAHARPLFVGDPVTALEAGAGEVGLLPMDAATASGTSVPAVSGLPLITLEYDWVIPRTSSQPQAAESFIRTQSSAFRLPPSSFTLTPLPTKARAPYAETWRAISNP